MPLRTVPVFRDSLDGSNAYLRLVSYRRHGRQFRYLGLLFDQPLHNNGRICWHFVVRVVITHIVGLPRLPAIGRHQFQCVDLSDYGDVRVQQVSIALLSTTLGTDVSGRADTARTRPFMRNDSRVPSSSCHHSDNLSMDTGFNRNPEMTHALAFWKPENDPVCHCFWEVSKHLFFSSTSTHMDQKHPRLRRINRKRRKFAYAFVLCLEQFLDMGWGNAAVRGANRACVTPSVR